MLYLIPTPIGNLADITFRSVEILKQSDYILCEDTRHSLKLLNHYGIHKPLKSYHKFNERELEDKILQDLMAGKILSLISDAGTPSISDPGQAIVSACIANNLPVTALPGPCAAVTALVVSGLPIEPFQFIGFLPKKGLKNSLTSSFNYAGTTICYESPNRLLKTLKVIHELWPNRRLVIARELTKLHEETARGTAEELISYFEHRGVQGEIVLLIGPAGPSKDTENWEIPIEEHVAQIQKEESISLKEAIAKVAKLRSLPKRQVYQLIHQKN